MADYGFYPVGRYVYDDDDEISLAAAVKEIQRETCVLENTHWCLNPHFATLRCVNSTNPHRASMVDYDLNSFSLWEETRALQWAGNGLI
ncbi:jg11581 [Pararge aegeria aegeria]|uniref:Jg11581 protein n=1 Tax=Pararge aegeria aegeria TaxID=348720 RepID=A0A8S4RRW3_9NEOP|nr:jg11581 [Pararge aegeria aegeria]